MSNYFFAEPIYMPVLVPLDFDKKTAIDVFLKKMEKEGVSIHPNFTSENFSDCDFHFRKGKLCYAVIFPVLNKIKIKKALKIIKEEENEDLKTGGAIGMSIFIENPALDYFFKILQNKFLIFPDKDVFLPYYQDGGKAVSIFHFLEEKSDRAINLISSRDEIDKDTVLVFFKKF